MVEQKASSIVYCCFHCLLKLGRDVEVFYAELTKFIP